MAQTFWSFLYQWGSQQSIGILKPYFPILTFYDKAAILTSFLQNKLHLEAFMCPVTVLLLSLLLFGLSSRFGCIQCTASCGGGIQRRQVKCVNKRTGVAEEDNNLCDHEPWPENLQKCNPQDCQQNNASKFPSFLRLHV